MFGKVRKMMGVLNERRPMKRIQAALEKRKGSPGTSGDNLNFEHKLDATDEEFEKTRDLNESDLHGDGSSDFSRTDVHRHDGGDTESLAYPHAPDLKGKGRRAA